ncbi:MAG TPA: hypothetical protein VLX12_05415 [Syntrophorhabdales bacterium]|nr:hypothetical protein [Syntrophorhabdales bacterium]
MSTFYTPKYLRIYVWQFLAVITNLISLFIVIPFLSKDPTLYGIYSVCVSTVALFNYGDLGFLSAGSKYAAENFARKERSEEIKVIGFVIFVLSVFLCFFAFLMLFFVVRPEILISGLNTSAQKTFASRLFTILLIFSPTVLVQRTASIIFGIRVEDFIYQKLVVGANLIKIASIYLFVSGASINIVGYFLFVQAVSLTSAVACLVVASKRYQYDLVFLLRSIRFSKEVYRGTRTLAFSSLFSTVTWVLFHELDLYAIARFLGPEQTAFYAIGFSIFSLLRALNGTIYAPFGIRFNHFRGLKDEKGLQGFYRKVVTVTQPAVFFPALSIVLLMGPLVLSWVGPAYAPSIGPGRLLNAVFLFTFLASPAALVILAREQTRVMNATSLTLVLVYWGGILLTMRSLGLEAFALMKLISFSCSLVVYVFVSIRLLQLSVSELMRRLVLPLLPGVAILLIIALPLLPYLPHSQGKLNLMLVCLYAGALALVGASVHALFSSRLRSLMREVARPLLAHKSLFLQP